MKLEIIKRGDDPFLTLDEVKNWCRVTGNEEDLILSSLITASVDFFEVYTGRVLINTTFKCEFKNEPIVLPKSPVIKVISELPNGAALKWDYQTLEIVGVNSLEVEFEAGYTKIPEIIKTWALNKICSWFENRENVVIGTIAQDLPRSHIDIVLDQFKVRRF
ncbi:head-tail connector protein [Campylobacter sp. RM16190]|uniref:head-tail connector protein n=1 Tax=Campylobacter sp. RM16190 TaxID=1705727 RepID=UPI0014740F4E|nr:head-tail connector protein [Campylobacter sp. RM16190]